MSIFLLKREDIWWKLQRIKTYEVHNNIIGKCGRFTVIIFLDINLLRDPLAATAQILGKMLSCRSQQVIAGWVCFRNVLHNTRSIRCVYSDLMLWKSVCAEEWRAAEITVLLHRKPFAPIQVLVSMRNFMDFFQSSKVKQERFCVSILKQMVSVCDTNSP